MTEEVACLAIPARLLHEAGLAPSGEYLGRTAPCFLRAPGHSVATQGRAQARPLSAREPARIGILQAREGR